MRALLPLALLLTTACYTPRATPDHVAQADPYGGWYDAPLEASLRYHENDGFASFQVNRPASVAIFALRPGGGVEMIYPRIGYTSGTTRFSSGTHYVRTTGSRVRLAGNWSMAHRPGPMYILMVASETPLNVNAFQATGTAPWLARSVLTYNPHYAMEALVDEVVRSPMQGDWTTAMQVVWPQSAWPDYRNSYPQGFVTVRCANGTIVTVPRRVVYQGYAVCPREAGQQPPEQPDTADVEGIRDAAPKRPQLPAGWMNTNVTERELKDELRRIRDLRGARQGLTRQAGLLRPTGEAGGAALRVAERQPESSGRAEAYRPWTARPGARGVSAANRPGAAAGESSRPSSRARPARRPAASERPARPSRPAASARPNRPKAEPRPAARPRPTPRPVRPQRPSRPDPRPAPRKPKPDGR